MFSKHNQKHIFCNCTVTHDLLHLYMGSYSSMPSKPLKKKAQKRILRIMSRVDAKTPTLDLFKFWKILPLKQLIDYNLCVTIYTQIHGSTLCNISMQLISNTHDHQTRSNSKELYITAKPKLSYGINSLQYKAVKAFNELPKEIRDISSIRSFKEKLFNYLLGNLD